MKFFYCLIIVLITSSCALDESNTELSSAINFKDDVNYIQLVEFLRNVESNNENDFFEFQEQVLNWIEAIDDKYLLSKTSEEIALFETTIMEDIYGSNSNRVVPINSFSTFHEVFAPIEEVWQTLVAVDEFPEWNEFTPRVETTFEIGTPIVMYVRLFPLFPNNILRQPEIVTIFNSEDEMCWESTFGSAFWMKSHRCYRVSEVNENTTILSSYMEYTGVLASLAYHLTKPLVLIGFNDVAEGLKLRIE